MSNIEIRTRRRKQPKRAMPVGNRSNPATDGDSPLPQAPIVPGENVAGNALTLVIAIMGFLASLTLGAMTLVEDTASRWQSEIAREITIQVIPEEGLDMKKALEIAVGIARIQPGISGAEIVDEAETIRLLEPWLGSDLNLDDLPVPRLINVTIGDASVVDFEDLRQRLRAAIPAASLDDHRTWLARLTAMARTTVAVGVVIFVLVVLATVLTVVFATRGAMSGNRHVIEVLHFVGAEKSYIARQFQRHFLLLGLKGAFAGAAAAMAVFALFGYWVGQNAATPEADQMSALFGSFSVGTAGYVGTFVLAVALAVLTALTSRMTVLRHVGSLDQNQASK